MATDLRHRTGARRLIGAACLVVQAGVLAALLTAPTFRVHTVAVTGDHLLSRNAVLAAAKVPGSSLFTVDGEAIRARVSSLPWVREATVSTQLPSTVQIVVREWQPDVLLRHDTSSTFVAGNGATLAYTQSTAAARRGIPLLLDYRPGAQRALPPGLAELLASASRRWPSVYGCSIDAFVISSANILSAWTTTGWQATFGAVDSRDAVTAIPGQLAVLAALKGRLDFTHPTFGYVDLENPTAPAVGGHPGEPAGVRSDIAGSTLVGATPDALSSSAGSAAAMPSDPATPGPSPTPAPTPRPTPSPLVFTLPAPTRTG